MSALVAVEDGGPVCLVIPDAEGEEVRYLFTVLAEPGAWALRVERLDGLGDGPWTVTRRPGRPWRCDCPDWVRRRKGRSDCKHCESARGLYKVREKLGVSTVPEKESEAPPAPPTPAQIADALAAPFDAREVRFKPQTISGDRALAVPYVDARAIQDRLDEAVGVLGWQDAYTPLPDGSVVCRLSIRVGAEWVTKEDIGGQSEQPDEGDRRKAAFSDALKRAAVKFGVGRYLYRSRPQWCDWDAQKRRWAREPTLAAAGLEGQPRAAKPGPAAPALPRNGAELFARLKARDEELARAGLCDFGSLIAHVSQVGQKGGLPPDLYAWSGEDAMRLAAAETKAFIQAARHDPRGTRPVKARA